MKTSNLKDTFCILRTRQISRQPRSRRRLARTTPPLGKHREIWRQSARRGVCALLSWRRVKKGGKESPVSCVSRERPRGRCTPNNDTNEGYTASGWSGCSPSLCSQMNSRQIQGFQVAVAVSPHHSCLPWGVDLVFLGSRVNRKSSFSIQRSCSCP